MCGNNCSAKPWSPSTDARRRRSETDRFPAAASVPRCLPPASSRLRRTVTLRHTADDKPDCSRPGDRSCAHVGGSWRANMLRSTVAWSHASEAKRRPRIHGDLRSYSVRHLLRLPQKLPRPALLRLMEVNIVAAVGGTAATADPQTTRGQANPGLLGASRRIRPAHRQGAVSPRAISGSGRLLR